MAKSETGQNGAQASANFLGNVQAKVLLLMHAKNVSRAALARSLGVTRSRVTHLLGADSNMTVDTLARIFDALGEIPNVDSAGIQLALANLDRQDGETVFAEEHRFPSGELADHEAGVLNTVFTPCWETEHLEVRASEDITLVIADLASFEPVGGSGRGGSQDLYQDAEMFELAA